MVSNMKLVFFGRKIAIIPSSWYIQRRESYHEEGGGGGGVVFDSSAKTYAGQYLNHCLKAQNFSQISDMF